MNDIEKVTAQLDSDQPQWALDWATPDEIKSFAQEVARQSLEYARRAASRTGRQSADPSRAARSHWRGSRQMTPLLDPDFDDDRWI